MALGSWAWQSFTYSGKRLNDTWWELNCMTELTVNSWCTGVSILLFDSNWWSLVPPSPYLDCIQAVWRGQIGHHELLRDENGSWICRYYFFYIKVQKKKITKALLSPSSICRKHFFWVVGGAPSLTFFHIVVWVFLLCFLQVSSWLTTCSSWSSCDTQRQTWLSTLTTLSPVWSDWRQCSVSDTIAVFHWFTRDSLTACATWSCFAVKKKKTQTYSEWLQSLTEAKILLFWVKWSFLFLLLQKPLRTWTLMETVRYL